MTDTMDPRYPVGRFQPEADVGPARVAELIDEIDGLPARLRAAFSALTPEEVDTPYRPEGWTPRQVVHHVADSHINAYVRYRLALTEDVPTIKPYREALWAQLPDVASTPPEVSLRLIEALHRRWVDMLRALTPEDLAREFYHPDQQRNIRLDGMLALYAWHGRHHVGHVDSVRGRGARSDLPVERPTAI